MKPIALAPNQFPHFYRGGARIAAFRGLAESQSTAAENTPEDWVGSTTTRFGQAELGLSRLPDGQWLRDAVAADPTAWLGPEQVDRMGDDLGVLVKLLDAGQRLLVHVHPDRTFARKHLSCRHGKTEAWVVLGTGTEDALVYVGFRDATDEKTLSGWVTEQDTDALLGALNPLPVRAGDAVLVPAGAPHAIGEGVFVAELQEPTDFSILLEWKGFDIDPNEGHLGVGYPTALQSVDRSAWNAARLERLRGPKDDGSERQSVLPEEAEPFFRAERIRDTAALEAGLAILVVTRGRGELISDAGPTTLAAGDTLIVPYAAGPGRLAGDVEAVRCRPPDPAAPDVPRPAI